MEEKERNWHKSQCKKIKKYNNPENKTLSQIQHEYAQKKGFKKWSDFISQKGE